MRIARVTMRSVGFFLTHLLGRDPDVWQHVISPYWDHNNPILTYCHPSYVGNLAHS